MKINWTHLRPCIILLRQKPVIILLVKKFTFSGNRSFGAVTWCYSDRASWIDYILITNLMHWLLFIHKILFSSTCFEPQMLIFRRIQLHECIIWYCHSLREFAVACRYTAWVRTDWRGKVVGGCLKTLWGEPTTFLLQSVLTQAVYRQPTTNSRREWHYHTLHVYNCIFLKMSIWGSKHVEENNILWVNKYQCIKLVINI